MDEERATGGFYDPFRVLDIRIVNKNVEGYVTPKVDDLSFKHIGPFTFINQPNYFYPHYFVSRIKIGNREYPILFYKYTGPLYIYIPRLFTTIFGKNIYIVRSLCLISLLLCILAYFRFLRISFYEKEAFLLTAFLFTHPFFSTRFCTFSTWANTIVFIFSVLLLIRMKKIFENSCLQTKDIFIFFLLGGLILHFHLLAGGALFASMNIAFFLTRKELSFKNLKFPPIFFSILIFLFLILPFATGISLKDILTFLSKGESLTLKKIILMPFLPIGLFIAFIFFPSFFIDMQIQGRFNFLYIFFSGLPGILIACSLYEIIRKESNFDRFVFFTICFYFIFSTFSPYLQPYHFNYIFILIVPFIFSYLQRSRLSKKLTTLVLTLSICLNVFQIEMLRKSVINSSFSFNLHKEVLKFLEENNIEEVYNFVGRIGYEFLSNGRIKTIDFHPYLSHRSKEKLYLSLLMARGKVIMVEKFKRIGLSTGIGPEEVMELARGYGLNIRVIKSFPSDRNPLITLMKVE
jgi:hypothetical protein